ncbi:T9SS type A sorting domain-containing protein [Tenacibaculum sp. MEBiC06402]|uniref:T9SS type A sorting domain-containing protein n=1 Tax=unclassified Tenacibaculum TaxID=2635139 RepID=UPI003B9D8DE7
MKTTIIHFVFCLFGFLPIFGQLKLVDEPAGGGSGFVQSVAVYDNDILYTFVDNSTTGTYGTYISNGDNQTRIDLTPGANKRALYHETISNANYALYGEGNFSAGKDIYAKIFQTGQDTYVAKLNDLRTLLIPDGRFTNEKPSGNKNIQLVANDGVITIDTISEGGNNKLLLRHFVANSADSESREYKLDAELFNSKPANFFNWNGKVFFVANVLGERDIYKIDALTDVRVTQNRVSKPTTFKGVTPNNFLLKDYIYFTGRDGFYTNVTPGPVERNYPTAICYTNGDIDFGSTETAIYNGDDGSLGYKAYSNTEFSSLILGKINSQILYYKTGSFGGSFHSAPADENLGINTQTSNSFKFIQFENEVFILSKTSNGTIRLYKTNGQASETDFADLPPFNTAFANNFGNIKINNDKLYFLAQYSLSGSSRYQLLSYDPKENLPISIEFSFPEGVDLNLNNFYAYNAGFVFTTNDGKLYSLNAEKRADVLTPNNANRSSLATNTTSLEYDTVLYNATINSVSTDVQKVKIQVLDTLSSIYQNEITNLPNPADKQRVANVFYNINSLEASANTNTFDIELSFDKNAFQNATVNASDISVLIYQNDTWQEITPYAFDEVNETVSVSVNLASKAYLFLKHNSVLSVQDEIPINSNNINLFPNPALNDITVVSKDKSIIQNVSLYTIAGQLVFKKDVSDYQFNTSINQLNSGIYIVRVKTASTSYIKKLIVE